MIEIYYSEEHDCFVARDEDRKKLVSVGRTEAEALLNVIYLINRYDVNMAMVWEADEIDESEDT